MHAGLCLLLFVLLESAVAIPHAREDCHQVLAPHGVTSDDSTIIGYGNDFTGSNPAGMQSVGAMTPTRAAEMFVSGCRSAASLFRPEGRSDGTTWPYVRVVVGGILQENKSAYITENGVNEAGLAIGFGAYDYPKPALSEPVTGDPWVDAGAGYEIWDLALMYCATPRCAVNLFKTMAQDHVCGYSNAVSGAMPVANWDEIWLIEIVSGHNMYAVRVPNTKIFVGANSFRIRALDLTDTANYIATDGLLNLAISSGVWDPSVGSFDPSVQFSVPSRSNTMRVARLHELYAPKYFTRNRLTYSSDLSKYPSFITPETRIDVPTVRANARDHGEGCPLFVPYDQMNPHHNPAFVPICRAFSGYNVIFVIPKPQTGVPPYFMFSPGSHCITSHVAVFSGTTAMPIAWSPYREVVGEKYSYMLFKLVGNELDHFVADPTDYGEHYPAIHETRDTYEADFDNALGVARTRIARAGSAAEKLAIKNEFFATTSETHYSMGQSLAVIVGIPH